MKQMNRISLVLAIAVFAAGPLSSLADEALEIMPKKIVLNGKDARQQILVSGSKGGRVVDLTREAKVTIADGKLAAYENGLVAPLSNGATVLQVSAAGQVAQIPIEIANAQTDSPVDFERDIIPIFSRFGCNAGACHGKARGQNGFQLSLLGFDANFDFDALVKEARGRRVSASSPENSLLLMKPTGGLPHGGGRLLQPDGHEYHTLLRWINAGKPRQIENAAKLERVSVYPPERVMANKQQQQVIVTAHYSDGTARDVTRLAAFQSNESPIAAVDEHGVISAGTITGEATIMARFMGEIAVCSVAVPLPGSVSEELYTKLPKYNFIDGHVWTKLRRLGITPSDPTSDDKFLRRAYIDVIGRVPTPQEAEAFIASKNKDKRTKLIDHLIEQPDFANHWANKWADLLRPNAYRVGIKAVLNYDNWIRDSFRKNKPYDQFVREIITAQGSTFRRTPVTFFRDRRGADELTTIVSQLFLGIRLECAKCHHHPFEVWGQDHFYSFAAYFSRVGRKGTGLSPPISGSEEIFFTGPARAVKHPLTGAAMTPSPLFGKTPEIGEEQDPREVLADWITKDNPFFQQVMVNRVWADIMGRGLVEPVDDLRATNPPTNAALLTALGEDFRDQGYDVKKLVRRITTSYVYGLSSLPSERNVVDTRNYSRHYRQRLRAEVLLDAVCEITGVEESYDAMPPESSAKEIWSHRISSLFLDAFGRPDPNQDPPCERTSETTVVQTLHLMNSSNLASKITNDSGRAAELAKSDKPEPDVIKEIYLSIYSRLPSDDEVKVAGELFKREGADRRKTVEDLMWALMNTPEFVFKD